MTLYRSLFHLSENPFGETPDTRFFFEATSHRRALLALRDLVSSRKGFAVLTGEVGLGKTLVSRIFLRSIEKAAHTALILFPDLSEVELLHAICDELRIPAGNAASGSMKAQMDRLNAFLLEIARSGRQTVLVVDEAHRLSTNALETIRLLTNLETEQQKLLQIVLIGQPELEKKLATDELRQLNQRVSIRERLIPFQPMEAERYIRHRLERAGGANFVRFSPDAVEWLMRRTGGIPRLLNRECERILEAAGRNRTHLISGSFAKQALGVPTGISDSLRKLWHRGGATL